MNATVKAQIESFYARHQAGIDDLAAYLGVPPLWLVSVFHLESGLNPNIKNGIGAVGLNQMLPSTLQQWNISAETFRNSTVEEQLEVMKKFFAPIQGKVKRAGDLYLFNLYPVAVIDNWSMDFPIGKDEDFTTRYGVSLNKIYDQNSGLDFNKDKILTRRDVVELFESKYDELVQGDFFFRDLAIDIKTNWPAYLAMFIVVVILIVVIVKSKS